MTVPACAGWASPLSSRPPVCIIPRMHLENVASPFGRACAAAFAAQLGLAALVLPTVTGLRTHPGKLKAGLGRTASNVTQWAPIVDVASTAALRAACFANGEPTVPVRTCPTLATQAKIDRMTEITVVRIGGLYGP